MNRERPRLPPQDEWLVRNVEVVAEIHGGKQSRVFDARLDGARTAIKLTERRLADIAVLGSRMEAVEALAATHLTVVAPARIGGALVQPIGGWLATAAPFVVGTRLDDGVAADARQLGSALAHLHVAMRELGRFEVPPVAALASPSMDVDRTAWQLLHGDFGTQNVIATPVGLRIIDFDDCGYGPIEYDIANSLYMVLFDSDVTKRPDRYDTFRPAFLAGYAHVADRVVAAATIDEMIDVRIAALSGWLGDLSTAPIGIRTSSPEWLGTLASFVESRRPTPPPST